MSAVLVTRDLKKHYKSNFRVRTIKALDGISIEVQKGEVYGFIGHNGAGKTTTIKILTGLIRATGGEAEVMGYKVGDPRSLAQVGFLPERPYFYEYLSAREALRFYGRLNNMPDKQIGRRADELLEMLDLVEAADRPMISYSKGMLQRFGMAQAMIHDPHLVILDEPMSGLDPVGRGQIKEIIQMLKSQGKTIFFSTHILSDVEQLCDRVAMVARGKLWFSGQVSELTDRYEHGVEFTLSDVTPEQRRYLDSLGATLNERPGRQVVMMTPDTQDTQALLAGLIEQGIRVESLVHRRTSLEEIFLREFKKEEEAISARHSDRP
jgi:ABC-2 type transport system ATP-binding protein